MVINARRVYNDNNLAMKLSLIYSPSHHIFTHLSSWLYTLFLNVQLDIKVSDIYGFMCETVVDF